MCHSTTWQEEKPQHSCSSNDHENKTAARNTDVFTSLQPPENKETAAHMLTDGKMQTIELHVLQKQRKTLFHYTQHTAQWTGCGARGMRAAWKGQRSIGLHWCWLLNGLEWGEMHSPVQNTQLKLNCPLFKENSIGLCRANGFIIVFISPFATQSRLQTFFMFSKL